MELKNVKAIVTGGASGLGEAVVREILKNGGQAGILDIATDKGAKLEKELGSNVFFHKTDITNEEEVSGAIENAIEKFGEINTVVNCAGIVTAGKTLGRKGPLKLDVFELTIRINLIGLFNVIRLASEKMAENNPDADGERGVIVNTASIAAFDGQMGQVAYAASKAGIVGMTLPIARDLSSYGIRNNTIAPGIFETPMMSSMPDNVRDSLIDQIPFPGRFGKPVEFANLVLSIVTNRMINGETIRIDGAIRMSPK